jgi:hypothetical protein
MSWYAFSILIPMQPYLYIISAILYPVFFMPYFVLMIFSLRCLYKPCFHSKELWLLCLPCNSTSDFPISPHILIQIPLTFNHAFIFWYMRGRVRADSISKSRNSATPAGVASMPTVYYSISRTYCPRSKDSILGWLSYTLTMIKMMLSPSFVYFYADVMSRETEWQGSDQFEMMLYLLVLRSFTRWQSCIV